MSFFAHLLLIRVSLFSFCFVRCSTFLFEGAANRRSRSRSPRRRDPPSTPRAKRELSSDREDRDQRAPRTVERDVDQWGDEDEQYGGTTIDDADRLSAHRSDESRGRGRSRGEIQWKEREPKKTSKGKGKKGGGKDRGATARPAWQAPAWQAPAWSNHPDFPADPDLGCDESFSAEERQKFCRDVVTKYGNGTTAARKACWRCGHLWIEKEGDEFYMMGSAIFSNSQFKLKEKKTCRMCVKGSWNQETW